MSTVSVDILRSVQDECSVFQTAKQTSVCDIIAQACSNVNVKCGNEASQTYICRGNQMGDAVATALMIKAAADGVDLRPALNLPPDAPDVDIKSATVLNVTNKCDSVQKAEELIRLNFDCKKSNDVIISAVNKLDQTTTCGVLAGEALYNQASGGKTPPGPLVPPSPTPKAYLIPIIVAVSVTVVLLLVIILCGVFVNRP
jgi:hypothetical protein